MVAQRTFQSIQLPFTCYARPPADRQPSQGVVVPDYLLDAPDPIRSHGTRLPDKIYAKGMFLRRWETAQIESGSIKTTLRGRATIKGAGQREFEELRASRPYANVIQ